MNKFTSQELLNILGLKIGDIVDIYHTEGSFSYLSYTIILLKDTVYFDSYFHRVTLDFILDKEYKKVFTIDATDMTLKEIRKAFKDHEEEEKQNVKTK